MNKIALCLATAMLSSTLIGCGSGGSSTAASPAPTPPPTATVVAVKTPANISVVTAK
ncbi:hypothetical protein AAKU67_001598 [Oxalobacteraceae bacterium GrIS 2.11]